MPPTIATARQSMESPSAINRVESKSTIGVVYQTGQC